MSLQVAPKIPLRAWSFCPTSVYPLLYGTLYCLLLSSLLQRPLWQPYWYSTCGVHPRNQRINTTVRRKTDGFVVMLRTLEFYANCSECQWRMCWCGWQAKTVLSVLDQSEFNECWSYGLALHCANPLTPLHLLLGVFPYVMCWDIFNRVFCSTIYFMKEFNVELADKQILALLWFWCFLYISGEWLVVAFRQWKMAHSLGWLIAQSCECMCMFTKKSMMFFEYTLYVAYVPFGLEFYTRLWSRGSEFIYARLCLPSVTIVIIFHPCSAQNVTSFHSHCFYISCLFQCATGQPADSHQE